MISTFTSELTESAIYLLLDLYGLHGHIGAALVRDHDPLRVIHRCIVDQVLMLGQQEVLELVRGGGSIRRRALSSCEPRVLLCVRFLALIRLSFFCTRARAPPGICSSHGSSDTIADLLPLQVDAKGVPD